MKFISHRGNIFSKQEKEENNPEKILHCISIGYDVEIDVWYINNSFYLGHDEPQYIVEREFLLFNNKRLWCHAKNLIALEKMLSLGLLNCFWHQEDDYTITSKGFIWTYPNKKLISNCIAVMPEITNYSLEDLRSCYGLCSDKISFYKEIMKNE